MSNTCYIFSPLFLSHCFSQVATNFTFTSETSLILLWLKCLPTNATKKSLAKIVEHKSKKAISDGIRNVQLGRFILLIVPISQQFPRLTSLYFFSFLNCRWILTAPFLENIQGCWTIIHSWKLENIPLQLTSYNATFMKFSLV